MKDATSQEEQLPTTTLSWTGARADTPLVEDEDEGSVHLLHSLNCTASYHKQRLQN